MADDDKKVVVPSVADSSIKPSDATRVVVATPPPAPPPSPEQKKLKTIKLKPLKTVAPAGSNDEETISMNREELSEAAPTGEEDATVEIDKMSGKASPAPQPQIAEQQGKEDASATTEDDETVKIEKVSRPQAGPATPSIPGVKQTIKLRPSSSSSAEDATIAVPSPSKQTLKLTPTPAPTQSAAEEATTATTSEAETAPKKTIKLVAKKPSAQTVKVDSPSSAPTVSVPEESPASGIQSTKKTLKLKGAPPPPAPASSDMGMATEHGAPPVAEPPQMGGAPQYQSQIQGQAQQEEASVITTVAASISLLALGYFTYQLFTQYKNLFM